jgi:hypothetical protein
MLRKLRHIFDRMAGFSRPTRSTLRGSFPLDADPGGVDEVRRSAHQRECKWSCKALALRTVVRSETNHNSTYVLRPSLGVAP